MASKYWVGGGSTTNWDATGNTNWSDTDGGANNATVPANGDDVFLKSSADCVLKSTNNLKSFNMTGYTGTLSGTDGTYLVIYPATGNTVTCLFAGTVTWTGQLVLEAAGTAVINLTTGGKSIHVIYGSGAWGNNTGTINQLDALNVVDTIGINCGTWNTNGFSITSPIVTLSGTETRAFNLTGATVNCTGTGTVWDATTVTKLTLTTTNSTINCAGSFAGGGKSYNIVTMTGDGKTISGNNTFTTLNVNTAGLATGLIFTIDSIQTVTNFTTNGSAGNLAKILSSLAGSHFHLTTTSAQISVDYMSIKDSVADQANVWYAGANSTDVSGNSGWVFTAPPLATKKTWMQRMNKNLLITMLNEEID